MLATMIRCHITIQNLADEILNQVSVFILTEDPVFLF